MLLVTIPCRSRPVSQAETPGGTPECARHGGGCEVTLPCSLGSLRSSRNPAMAPEGVGTPAPSQCRRPQVAPLTAAVFTVCLITAEFLQQPARRLRRHNSAAKDFLVGDIGAVHGFVSAVVGLHDSAIHAGPGKDSFTA